MVVYTVGHGARPIEEFLAVLRAAVLRAAVLRAAVLRAAVLPAPAVSTLVDVRRFPGSRRHPQFGRSALADALAAAGIGYEWQGEALGGRRSGRSGSRHTALHNAAFAGYADHMDGTEFRAAVEALVGRAGTERLAIMCAETLWWHCHRMLVADALTLRGATVVHLLQVGRQEPHRLHPTVRRGEDGWPVYDVADTLPGLG